MDVTCNRCGNVYEFEEALISTTGTTVKCTQCGHLFKVHRSSAPAASLTPVDVVPDPPRWRVRRVDGSVHTLESLADLMQLISAGQFGADDEISRTGQIWKRLGAVAELASLFDRAPRPRRMSEPPVPPPPEPQLDPTPASEDRAKRTTIADSPGAAKRRRRVTADPLAMEILAGLPRPAPEPAPSPAPVPALAQREDAALDSADSLATAPHQPLPLTPSVASVPLMPATLPALPASRESDLFLPLGTERSRGKWLAAGVALLLAGGTGAAVYLQQASVASVAPPPPSTAEAQSPVRRGDDALAAHRIERFDDAIAAYDEALALHADDPHILSSLSRVYAVWAAWLQFEMRDLRISGQGTPAQLDATLAKTRALIENAKRFGERAAQRNPGNEEASVALSDALRLSGNLVAARAELDRARATQGVAPAETLRVAALLAIDEADSEIRAGRAYAEKAVAADPTLLRARFLLARCLFDDGDAAGAEAQLAAVRAIDPEHPLLAAIAGAGAERARRKAASASTTPGASGNAPDAGSAKRADAQGAQAAPRNGGAPKPGAAASASTAADARSGGESDSVDPLELVRRGEAALERGAVGTAQRAFERALALEPRSARAKTGLGYVALERNQPIIAISHFRSAASRDHADALIGLGDAYRKLGRTKDALEAYRSYLKRFPKGDQRSIAQRQSELLAEQLEESR
jgi:predicted Zn finger-like uncharacterized protein